MNSISDYIVFGIGNKQELEQARNILETHQLELILVSIKESLK